MLALRILNLESRQFNFWAFVVFFLVGVFVELALGFHSFIYLSLLTSFAFSEKADQQYFQDPTDLGEYSAQYLPSIYRAFMSIAFVILAYTHSAKITLDIAFFILWSLGYSVLGFATTFVPKNGFKHSGSYKTAQIYCLVLLVSNLILVNWLIINFSGFNWFSSVITKPLGVVIGGL